jgi:hypothetical protein
MTPGTVLVPFVKDWTWSCACEGSDRLQDAVFPSAVTAGTENTCAVLPGMYAEYMGENTMLTVGLVQAPASPLTLPPSDPVETPLSAVF